MPFAWRLKFSKRKIAFWFLGGLTAVLMVLVILGWRAFGHRAEGARRERIARSPEWQGDHFENPQPMKLDYWGSLTSMLRLSPNVSPSSPIPFVPLGQHAFETPAASGLRVTWLGHSSSLIEIDGVRVLTDPAWSERASPYGFLGPKRWFPSPLSLANLPPIDAVVISHDHYDHLDFPTIVGLKDLPLKFFVPLGLGAHLEYWGVAASKIVELDWWEKARVGNVEVTCTPARHASGREVLDYGSKLWAGWAFVGPEHRVYYSGDTGLFPALAEIGDKLGPFDLTLLEVGQYGEAWPDWHLGPEQAVRAHAMLHGRVMLPVHWGAFALAYHGWTEPIERVLVAARDAHVSVATPKPGQSFEPRSPPNERWWPDLPWKTAAEAPIVATGLE